MDGRRAGRLGWGFLLLLLVSAAMVTVPGGDDAVARVRDFYTAHAGVVVTANVVGLLAALVCWRFAVALADGAPGAAGVRAGGTLVAGAAGLTAVPVLLLCAVAGTAAATTVHALAVASDLTDVLLFTAIAVFAGAVARGTGQVALRVLAVVVLVLAGARAVALLLGSALLELVAPVSFVVLVGCVSTLCLVRRSWR